MAETSVVAAVFPVATPPPWACVLERRCAGVNTCLMSGDIDNSSSVNSKSSVCVDKHEPSGKSVAGLRISLKKACPHDYNTHILIYEDEQIEQHTHAMAC